MNSDRDDLPLVTVITPTHNRRQLLEQTVSSVLAQDLARLQMVVVDDASSDDTWEWLQSVEDPRVDARRLDHHMERSAARNLGLRAARGRYVLFLDDDDILPPSALGHHVSALDRRPDAIASVGSRMLFTDEGAEVLQQVIDAETVLDVWSDFLLGWVAVSGATLFRADAFREVGGWDESYVIAEDYELWGRISRSGPIAVSPDVVLRYRVHGGQWRSANHLELMEEIRARAVEASEGWRRQLGADVIEARRLMVLAQTHLWQDRHLRALGHSFKARRVAGDAFRSPLVPAILDLQPVSVWRSLLMALIPRTLLRLARRLKQRGNDVPQFKTRIVEGADGRRRPQQPAASDR